MSQDTAEAHTSSRHSTLQAAPRLLRSGHSRTKTATATARGSDPTKILSAHNWFRDVQAQPIPAGWIQPHRPELLLLQLAQLCGTRQRIQGEHRDVIQRMVKKHAEHGVPKQPLRCFLLPSPRQPLPQTGLAWPPCEISHGNTMCCNSGEMKSKWRKETEQKNRLVSWMATKLALVLSFPVTSAFLSCLRQAEKTASTDAPSTLPFKRIVP